MSELQMQWRAFIKALDICEEDKYKGRDWVRREDFEAFMHWVDKGYLI